MLPFLLVIFSCTTCSSALKLLTASHFKSGNVAPEATRSCASPELSVPWPYGQCAQPGSSSAIDSSLSCGACGQNSFVRFMTMLSEHVKELKKDECSQMVVYGVAFGPEYEEMLNTDTDQDVPDVLKRHQQCSFVFVAERSGDASGKTNSFSRTSKNGLHMLISVPSSILPYKSARRNAKLIKIYGGLLVFSFAEQIIWQDAKLLYKFVRKGFSGSENYLKLWKENVDDNAACTSFTGLPNHASTIGEVKPDGVRFNYHCGRLQAPDERIISDDAGTIGKQCSYYQELDKAAGSRDISLDSGMIDSAFIKWDMRSEKCRTFNLKLSCTWLGEIQCFSDRDQISFPQALISMGVHEPNPVTPIDAMSTDKLFVGDDPATPMVRIGRSQSHWYFWRKNIVLPPAKNTVLPTASNADASLAKLKEKSGKRVAIVVPGSFNRFNLNSSLHHLIRPLVAQGHQVDYYTSLTYKANPAYRSDNEYTQHQAWDPVFDNVCGGDTDNSNVSTRLEKAPENCAKEIAMLIENEIKKSGGLARKVVLKNEINIDAHPSIVAMRAALKSSHPGEDPDTRFPVLDLREGRVTANANMNRNMLRLFLNMQNLWDEVVAHETTSNSKYDYVMFLRDDTLWLSDFVLDDLIAQGQSDAYVLSCNARDPPLHPLEFNDHGGVLSRDKAEVFGKYFDRLLHTNLNECQQQMDDSLTKGGIRSCNSEMILKHILKKDGVSVREVGQRLIPFQRSMYVRKSGGEVTPCFHKYCQSHEDSLPSFGLQQCKDLTFDKE